MSASAARLGALAEQPICVVGGSGALGRRVVGRLQDLGASRLRVFDLRASGDAGVARVITGDLLDGPQLGEAVDGCAAVFHLAAAKVAGESSAAPTDYFRVNAMGTVRVLDACRDAGVGRLVYASTSHVYGLPEQLPIPEEHPCAPLSVYAASKLAGEAAVHGYASAFGLRAEVARMANIYGAAMGSETVMGLILEQAATGSDLSLRNLDATREFLYVDDAAEALIRLAAVDAEPGTRTTNVSSGEGVTVGQAAKVAVKVAAELGCGDLGIEQTGDPADERVPALVLDNRRLRELAGWVPQTSLAEGIRAALRERLNQ